MLRSGLQHFVEKGFRLARVTVVEIQRGQRDGLADGGVAIARFDQDVAKSLPRCNRVGADFESDVQGLDGLAVEAKLSKRFGVHHCLVNVSICVELVVGCGVSELLGHLHCRVDHDHVGRARLAGTHLRMAGSVQRKRRLVGNWLIQIFFDHLDIRVVDVNRRRLDGGRRTGRDGK